MLEQPLWVVHSGSSCRIRRPDLRFFLATTESFEETATDRPSQIGLDSFIREVDSISKFLKGGLLPGEREEL